MDLRPIIRDAPANEWVRIAFARIDLRQEAFGPDELLGPASGRGETNLLIRQLFQGRIFEASHSHHSFTASCPGPSQASALVGARRVCGSRPAPAAFVFSCREVPRAASRASSFVTCQLPRKSKCVSVRVVRQPMSLADSGKTLPAGSGVRGISFRISMISLHTASATSSLQVGQQPLSTSPSSYSLEGQAFLRDVLR